MSVKPACERWLAGAVRGRDMLGRLPSSRRASLGERRFSGMCSLDHPARAEIRPAAVTIFVLRAQNGPETGVGADLA
jgi:hypothetical protein